jgi:hypothetical protein
MVPLLAFVSLCGTCLCDYQRSYSVVLLFLKVLDYKLGPPDPLFRLKFFLAIF